MKVTTIELAAPLEGLTINVDENLLTMGMLEQLESNSVKSTLDALAHVIRYASAPGAAPQADDPADIERVWDAHIRGWLTGLRAREFKAVLDGVMSLFRA